MIIRYLCLLVLLLMSPQGAQAQEALDDTIYDFAEEMPAFPSCKEKDRNAQQQCNNIELTRWINSELKYPSEARGKNITGQPTISFVIDKTGSITDIRVEKSAHPILDAEVVRVVQVMNMIPEKWTVGKHKGQPVNVRLKIRPRFSIK